MQLFSAERYNIKNKKKIVKKILCNFLVQTLQYLKNIFHLIFAPENMKKLLSKVAPNRPKTFFSVLPTGPKSSQIS